MGYIDGKCYHIYHTWILFDVNPQQKIAFLPPAGRPRVPRVSGERPNLRGSAPAAENAEKPEVRYLSGAPFVRER